MPLARKSTINQLKRIRSEIRKSGGDIGDKTNVKREMKLPNSLWIDNPVDRHIDAVNDYITLEMEKFSTFLEAALPRKSTVKQFKKLLSKTGEKSNISKKLDTINKHVKLETESMSTCVITDDDIHQTRMYACTCPNCGCDSNICDDKYGFNGMNCEECRCEFIYEK